MQTALDHLVINTRFETDTAVQVFAALGFTLTPRGYHSLGSLNHLMMFPGGYLELIGLPLGTRKLRQEVLDSPVGIDGLVLNTQSAHTTHGDLVRAGFLVQTVQRFSRTVEHQGRELQARFTTVRMQPEQFAAGRVYYCHHETPELIWQPQWLNHANGVTAILKLTVLSSDPQTARERYAALGELEDGFSLDVVDQASLEQRFGASASHLSQRGERFAAITLRCADPAELATRAEAAGLSYRAEAGRVMIEISEFETLLEFVS
ncbi:VOC family protein [Pseudomonas corrugata]|uniref:VOC family protein n=1 Tax=Pseudomonas corrugata TaxID=47879 RepID=UPI0015863C19|nr:VOC family protein [Pseudomonas corrugata]MCI0997701.1 VOC family protein [Pseudomonas corrugata]NUT64636.1 VOC family protein [Pseudomonas corrugata]